MKKTAITAEEYQKLKTFKTECFVYAREHFQGKSFWNENRQVAILVSRTGQNEWLSKTKIYEQAKSIMHLDIILENAVYNHSSKNEHPKQGDEGSTFDYYDYSLEMDGEKYAVVLTVKKVAGQGSIYYHHYLDDIKIKPSSSMIQP